MKLSIEETKELGELSDEVRGAVLSLEEVVASIKGDSPISDRLSSPSGEGTFSDKLDIAARRIDRARHANLKLQAILKRALDKP